MKDFKLNKKLLLSTDFVEIVSNYTILHFDDIPILYSGTTKYGNKVIGSHLDENDKTQSIFSLQTILTDEEFYNFLNGKTSYLNVLKQADVISVIEKDYELKVRKVYAIDFQSIPLDYLPTEDSFCPSTAKASSLEFSISLKGKLADMNKALAGEVSKIQTGFVEFLEDRIKSLKGFRIIPQARLHPYSVGSFKINFELDISQIRQKGNNDDIFVDHTPFDKYISTYIRYVSENFSEDRDVFVKEDSRFSEKLENLKNVLSEVYESASISKPENIDQFLKEDIVKSATNFEKLTEHIGANFDNASISNITHSEETTLAFIDKEFSERFQAIVEDIEITRKGLTVDDTYKDYQIYIYHLNTDTRKGNALIKHADDEKVMSKPKISINGDDALEQTKYTESLHFNQWISVKAKARKIGEKYRQLDIEYEN